jgi:ribosome biogenesis ATPase
MADWEVALPKVQPSVRREGFTTKPDVTWEDVGALEEVSRVTTWHKSRLLE